MAYGYRCLVWALVNITLIAGKDVQKAIIKGARILDTAMAGLGHGAGNCPIGLLVGFLHNPKFCLRPILKCIQQCIEPLREKLMWGFDTPYMIAGAVKPTTMQSQYTNILKYL